MGQVGTALREARMRRGLSIEQAAQDTRIALRFLQALEAERYDLIPAPVYVRGFLRSYAGYLRLDPQALLEEALAEAQELRPLPPVPAAAGHRAAARATRPERSTPWAALDEEDAESLERALLREPPVRRAPPPRREEEAPGTEEGVLVERGGPRREIEFPRKLLGGVAGGLGLLTLIAIGVAMDSPESEGALLPGATTPAGQQVTPGTVITVGTPTPEGGEPTAEEGEGEGEPTEATVEEPPAATAVPPSPTPVPPTPTPEPPTATAEPPTPTPSAESGPEAEATGEPTVQD